MNEAEARKNIRVMLWAVQKARSIILEGLGEGISQEVKEYFHPWILGRKCPILVLLKMTESEAAIKPIDFYNMIIIATRFAPEIGILAVSHYEKFPGEAKTEWLGGWDK